MLGACQYISSGILPFPQVFLFTRVILRIACCRSTTLPYFKYPQDRLSLIYLSTNGIMAAHRADVEKDYAGHDSVNGNYDLHHNTHDEDTALSRIRTAGSISISPELFEKIYLSPKNRVSNNIRSTFGNPTPL